MVFSSLPFLYVFLPLSFLAYQLVSGLDRKNTVLIVSSLIFYAWAGPWYVLLLLGMVAINWMAGLLMAAGRRKPGLRKGGLWLALIGSLGLLGFFKYTGFLLGGLQALTGFPSAVPEIVLPIGISFYTFQLLSYSLDVYRGDVKAQRSYKVLLLYASLFHQCIAGPIVRYRDVETQILGRRTSVMNTSYGVWRFAVGLAKKALLANTCAAVFDRLVPQGASLSTLPAVSLWAAMGTYMLQIYLDFSAYSDMAIGLGRMVGFHYRENFDYPYTSRSVSEFWRRWHISLGSFFRDYVYIPLGGNRRGLPRTIWNLFIVWALTGLWHGASWNYVLWGLYFFVFIALEKIWLRGPLERMPAFFSRLYLLAVVFFGWILFKFESMADGWTVFKGLFGLNGNAFITGEGRIVLLNYLFFFALAIAAVTPLGKRLMDALDRRAEAGGGSAAVHLVGVTRVAVPILLLILSTLALIGNSYNPFLYFQF
ncbi:MAG: MBOAT family O-acyltransferase [Acutalibacteraceae bacterium]|jgi:alginate O-acetyltransferase complex protein AlgI